MIKMPWLVHTNKIAEDLQKVSNLVQEKQVGLACKELRKICRGIQSVWQTIESTSDLDEYMLRYYTELEDIQEKESLQESGSITGKKTDLNAVVADLEKVYQYLDQNNSLAATTLLEETCNALQNRRQSNRKYDDPGKIGDLILQARTDLKKQSKIIATEKSVAQMVNLTDVTTLIEKYIDQAYEEGRIEGIAEEKALTKPKTNQ